MAIRHNQDYLDQLKVEKILNKKNPFEGRHNKKQLIRNFLARQDACKRYTYTRGSLKGKPTLKVSDNYLSPLITNDYEFVFTGIDELDAYGALLIEKLIKMLGNESMPTPTDQMGHTLR